jgi:transposase, IS5 family
MQQSIKAGFTAKKGQIVDATFVETPRKRNSRDENETIKGGGTPDDWKENPSKLSQKDLDARWTKKNNETHYGYKNHLNVDAKHKLIRDYEVTPADVHDSQVLEKLFDSDNTGKALWADSAYKSEEIDNKLTRRRLKNNINRKGYRNHPLSKFQELMNRKRSSVRARIEHVNARLDSMIGRWIHYIGRLRAENDPADALSSSSPGTGYYLPVDQPVLDHLKSLLKRDDLTLCVHDAKSQLKSFAGVEFNRQIMDEFIF